MATEDPRSVQREDATAYLLVPDPNIRFHSPWGPLVDLAEFAPGVQVLQVVASGARFSQPPEQVPPGTYIIFNCEFFVPIDIVDRELDLSVFIPKPSYAAFMRGFNVQMKTQVTQGLPPPGLTPQARTTLVTSVHTTAGEKYWRVSAYANDRRVGPDRELVHGSYVTSDADFAFVSSGLAAVGRYALPTPFPAVHAFQIQPEPGRAIDLGTVRPLYGQAGGGVEGVFQSSTGRWTVSNHVRVLPAW